MATVEHPTDTLISLTPFAAAKIRELMAEEDDAETLVLRVAIQGGGCSGFQYGLGFDAGAAEGDVELSLEGIPVVVDPYSAPYLRGTTIDFLNTISESGFKIDNPNAVSSCGCGHSFQVDEGEELPEGTEVGGCGSRLLALTLSTPRVAPLEFVLTCRRLAPSATGRSRAQLCTGSGRWSCSSMVVVQIGLAGYGAFYVAQQARRRGLVDRRTRSSRTDSVSTSPSGTSSSSPG